MGRLRTCPDCRREISTEAAACPQCGRVFRGGRRPASFAGPLLALAITLSLLALFAVYAPDAPRPGAPAAQPTPPILGQEVRVGTAEEQVVLAVDDPAWDEMTTFQAARDIEGLDQLVRRGRAFIVAGGTAGRRIEVSVTADRVRIAEGPNAGQAGWVQHELVHPAH